MRPEERRNVQAIGENRCIKEKRLSASSWRRDSKQVFIGRIRAHCIGRGICMQGDWRRRVLARPRSLRTSSDGPNR
jgi:hypothetical protein